MTTTKITIDNQTIIRVISITMLFLVSLLAIWYIKKPLILIALSFFFALAINPPVSFVVSKMPKHNRVLGTLLAYIIVLGLLLGIFVVAIPPLISQTIALVDQAPEYIDDLKNRQDFMGNLARSYNLADQAKADLEELGSRLGDISGPIFSSLGKVSSLFLDVITVLVITFFMLIEGPKRVAGFWAAYPSKYRAHHKELANKMYAVVTSYVNGQLLIASISGFASLLFMLVVGVPYAMPLSFLVGAMGLIPLIGATIAAVVVVAISLIFESATTALIMAIYFIIYQQLENNAIQPYIQAKTMEISPLIVFCAVIVGISAGGVIGAFVSIPIAGCLRVLVLDYYKQHNSKKA